jgi:DNA-nicking Smr family endonuclease
MRAPRGLSAEEAALWRRVASSVTPLVRSTPKVEASEADIARPPQTPKLEPVPAAKLPLPPLFEGKLILSGRPASQQKSGGAPVPKVEEPKVGLDAGWERKLAKGLLEPDFTLDLHGATLDGAHARLGMGLSQARAMGARVVLLITGRPRPVEAADRGHARGAIRAKVVDWLAAGEHAGDIAAIRGAHRRHGGAGALYLILRRRR